MQIFEIRSKTFALAPGPGKKATTVVQWSKKHNRYIGVRGVRPTIPDDLKPATQVSKAVREAIRNLAAN